MYSVKLTIFNFLALYLYEAKWRKQNGSFGLFCVSIGLYKDRIIIKIFFFLHFHFSHEITRYKLFS